MVFVIGHAMPSIRWVCNSTKWQPSKSDWIRAAQCIQPEEAKRIGKFVFKRDAKSSMVGRLMLRRVIHHVTKIPYVDIKLARTAKGKPYLENNLPTDLEQFSFNVSHQGDLVVLAAETNCDVGVDVMNTEVHRAKSVPEFFHTMRRQFTEGEWLSIRSHMTESDQLKTFYRLWCLKESYVKALGVGIGFEVNRLDFKMPDPILNESQTVCSTCLVLDGQKMIDWTFEETCIEGHCVAVAVNRNINLNQLDFKMLDPILSESQPVCTTCLVIYGHQKTDWMFEEILIEDHCMAVAVNRKNNLDEETNSKFTTLTVNELLQDIKSIREVDDEYGETFINKDESPQLLNRKTNV